MASTLETAAPPAIDPLDLLRLGDGALRRGAPDPRQRARVRARAADPAGRRLVRGGPAPARAGEGVRRARRARHAPRGLRLRGRERDGLRPRVPGARGRRLRPPLVRVRAGLARDVRDLALRLRGAEAGVAAADGRGRGDRLLRPDRARLRLRPGGDAHHARSATATTGSSTASKMWITNGSIADVAVVWARTDDGVRGFVVPTRHAGLQRAGDPPEALAARVGDLRARPRRRPPAGRRASCPRPTGLQCAARVPQRGALRDRLRRDGRGARLPEAALEYAQPRSSSTSRSAPSS